MLSLYAAPTAFLGSAPLPSAPRAAVQMQEAVEAPPSPPPFDPVVFAKSLPGVSGPLGFFDPIGFCSEATEGKIRFYRGALLEPPVLRSLS
jgi:hypothetical protein